MEAKLDAILSSVAALNFKISDLEMKIDGYHQQFKTLEQSVDQRFQEVDHKITQYQSVN